MNISELSKCSNCEACYNVCPKGAISVNQESTFYALAVDADKCVDCGLCVDICPVENNIGCNKPIAAYGGWHKDQNVVLKSSSGGAMNAIATTILEKGGVVFGATFANDNKSVFISNTDLVSLSSLQKSKYVESIVGSSFVEARCELDAGRMVLFCGTPCQIAGLQSFLDKEYNNLITCDFACGGVPSHELFRSHIDYLEQKYASRALSVDFRPKTYGWKRYSLQIKFENGKVYNRLAPEDPYLCSFLYGKRSVRPYCLECKFSDNHLSDLTLADFWLHKEQSNLENSDGISLVLANTSKGEAVIKLIEKTFVCESLDINKSTYNNKPTVLEISKKKSYDEFIQSCKEIGLNKTVRKFYKMPIKTKIKLWLSRLVHNRSGRG